MHRLLHVIPAAVLLTGCPMGCLGIELGEHPLKPEGICASRGGYCTCVGTNRSDLGEGRPSRYPQLDCVRNPFICPVVCVGAGDYDDAGVEDPGPADARTPRLIVASAGTHSLAVWNNANTLEGDAAPAESLPVPGGVAALSRSPGVLAVGLENMGVVVFDAPRSLNRGAAPQASISVGGGAAVLEVSRFEDDLWVLMKTGSVHKLADVTHLTSASTPLLITSPVAFDAMTFAPFNGGPAVIASEASTGKLLIHGIPYTPDFFWNNEVFLAANTAHRLTRGGSTLFSGGRASGSVEARQTGNLGGGDHPKADLTLVSGFDGVVQLSVQHDVLVVVGTGGVGLYLEASRLIAWQTPPLQPAVSVTHSTIGVPVDAMLGADGTLYVLDGNGVSIFRDALKQPVFVTEITSGIGQATALTLIE